MHSYLLFFILWPDTVPRTRDSVNYVFTFKPRLSFTNLSMGRGGGGTPGSRFYFFQKITRRSNKYSKGSNTKCLKVTQHGQGSLLRAQAIYIKKGQMSKGKVKVGFSGKESELQWGQQKQRIERLL